MNQATDTVNDALTDVAYSVNMHTLSHYDWVLDSGTMSHICNHSIPAQATDRGTVITNLTVKGNNIWHKLQDVLHIPEAPNSLLSVG
ncbi:hypothetical protein PILCRDRAFT_75717 [Piloderma croceum F 1598]|uniref:Uncharacterized protein n=1 Tax=Piloderma croceum (strain F 1598) TaxID=765440 RepID=A0A0C3F0S8_PILCF|nr:hypothetical protein PILCRDRAFT_75717 [Piloderma croceum F 1598]